MSRTSTLTLFLGGLLIGLAEGDIVQAQPRLSLSGYAISFPVFQETEELVARFTGDVRQRFLNTTRVRLRPSLDFDDGSFLRLEWEAAATYTSRGLSFHPTLEIPGQIAHLAWNPIRGNRWAFVHAIDRLFFRTTTGFVEWTLGRQRIAWGSGRVWNPTDLFNPLNPAVVVKTEKDGVDALAAKAILGNFSDATFVWNPRNDRPSNYGIRLRSNISGFDFAGVAGRFDSRWSAGADVTGSVMDAGIRFEALWSGIDLNSDKRYLRAIIGVDNQFTERLYGMAEYHFNGRGTTDRFRYDVLALARGEIVNVGREFAALQASYLLHPLVSLTVIGVRSFTDRSGSMGFTLSYNASEETTVAVGGQYFFGDPLTEYRYYPRTLYVRLEMYF